MKRLLLVSYHFPPDAAIGAVRPGKFAQYLPEFGWEPIVMTVKERHYDNHDPEKMASILSTLKIHRVPLLPGPLQLYTMMRNRLLRVAGCGLRVKDKNGQEDFRSAQTSYGSPGQESVANPPRSLHRFVSSLLRLPDVYQGWIISVAIEGYMIIKKGGIDTLMTSGPPMSTHLGGLLVKFLTGVRWVADFRDPWMSMQELEDQSFRTEWRNRVERRLERLVINKADRVITTTPSVARYFQSLLGGKQQEKVCIVMNGYDNSDFENLHSPTGPSCKTRICHAGTLYYGRNPEPLFQALSRLIDRGELDKNTIELEFIGNSDFNGHPLSLLAKKYDLTEQIILVGKIDFHDSLRRQASAHGLLLLAQKQPYAIPAKVFEYLRMNKPTLAIADEGDTKDLLSPIPHCFVADPNRNGDIENKLQEMLNTIKGSSGSCFSPTGHIEQFSRRNLAIKLASLL